MKTLWKLSLSSLKRNSFARDYKYTSNITKDRDKRSKGMTKDCIISGKTTYIDVSSGLRTEGTKWTRLPRGLFINYGRVNYNGVSRTVPVYWLRIVDEALHAPILAIISTIVSRCFDRLVTVYRDEREFHLFFFLN